MKCKDVSVSEPGPERLPPVMQDCWRCQKTVEASISKCPHCGAPLRPDEPIAGSPRLPSAESQDQRRALVAFALTLLVSVGFAVFQSATAGQGELSEKDRLVQISVLELIDVIIVLVAFFSISRAVVTDRPNHGLGFLLLFPMLALALGINFGYHWIINNHLGVTEGPVETQSMSYLPWYLVVICLQPAIFEELFFRSVLFRPLQKVMGNHMTVLVTSVMFGVAHIYVPLSIPMLISMGIILGYLRLWTGSLIVPMLLHFIHNGVILALQLQA